MTGAPIAPIVPPSDRVAGRDRKTFATNRRVPLAAPPANAPVPRGTAYGIGRIDASGHAVIGALGWCSGDRLTLAADAVRRTPSGRYFRGAPRGPGGDAGPARPAFSVLFSVAVLRLAGRRGHCTTDQTKVAVPETPAVSVAVTVTV